MHFGFTPDQEDLRGALRELLKDACPPSLVRSAWDPNENPLPTLWKRIGELGLLGLLIPDSAGGLGYSEVELVLLLEECGRFALPGPIGEHIAVGVPALSSAAAPELPQAVAGEVLVTAQDRPNAPVRWAGVSDLIIRHTDDGLVLMRSTELDLRTERSSVDYSIPMASVVEGSGTALSVETPSAYRRGVVAAAAQLLGLADQLITVTAEYVKVRQQFGAPIGSQQAIKHLLATALVALEHARPVVYRAGWVLAAQAEQPDLAVSFAKVYATRAARLAARSSLQCHGAIAYTWEHDLHLWIKRVWALSAAWGTPAEHEDYVAAAVLDDAC